MKNFILGNDGGTDLVTDSFEGAFHPAEDLDARRSKSLDGDAILGPNSPLIQHLSKVSLLRMSPFRSRSLTFCTRSRTR